jgi:hypothetical protein
MKATKVEKWTDKYFEINKNRKRDNGTERKTKRKKTSFWAAIRSIGKGDNFQPLAT